LSLDETLAARSGQYGDFAAQAKACQLIKAAFAKCDNWAELDDDAREGLEMIAMKVSRILTGNPKNYDSWHDIAGYSEVVARKLKPPSRGKVFLDSQPYIAALQKKELP
jgi:hypothetical protein